MYKNEPTAHVQHKFTREQKGLIQVGAKTWPHVTLQAYKLYKINTNIINNNSNDNSNNDNNSYNNNHKYTQLQLYKATI